MSLQLTYMIPLTVMGITTTHAMATTVKTSAQDVQPLQTGKSIPKVALANAEGKQVELTQIVAKTPSVLVFYRGGWCPFCNAQLSRLGKIEKDIQKLGYQLLAISPDTPQSLQKTVAKNQLNYTLLSDVGGKAAARFGLAFHAPEGMRDKLIKMGHDIPKERRFTLPIPAVYVVNTKGTVVYKFSNPNYKVRLDEKKLLSELKKHKN